MIISDAITKLSQSSKKVAPTLTNATKGLFFHQNIFLGGLQLQCTQLQQNLLNLTLGRRSPSQHFSSKVRNMQLPVGVSNFRELVETRDPEGNPYSFVDKSLFIKEIIDDPSKVKLFIRPRRFLKTSNMSMLHHFFAREVGDLHFCTLEIPNKEVKGLYQKFIAEWLSGVNDAIEKLV